MQPPPAYIDNTFHRDSSHREGQYSQRNPQHALECGDTNSMIHLHPPSWNGVGYVKNSDENMHHLMMSSVSASSFFKVV
jgi:hypothetical protein